MTKEEQDAQTKVEADKKSREAAAAAGGGDGGQIDPTIAAIMKDPDAVKALLEAKRAANDEAKKLRLKQEAADAAQKAKDDAALAEQGKFKELAERHKGEAEAAKKLLAQKIMDFELKFHALQAGANDPGDVLALCNRSGIKLSDDGSTVDGAKEAVEAVKRAKPYLFKTDDDSNHSAPPGDKKPPLKNQIAAANDGIDPISRIERGLEKLKK